jgi:hypothetical protein
MSDQFRRSWRAQVGSLVIADSSAGAKGGLDITFKCKRTLAARAGTLELEVFNLNQAHRHELATLPRRRTFVSLDAGYEGPGGASRLFTGDLRKVVVARAGVDFSVKVTAGDGEHSRRSTRVSRSFVAGTSLTAVVQHLAEAMEVGIGNAVEALRGSRFAGGASSFEDGAALQGGAADELARMLGDAGLMFSIQDNALMILPLGGSLGRTALLISPSTGMVDSPEIVNRRTITVKALIQPGFVPGQTVVVDSSVASGVWRITECEASGSTASNDWYCTMTCTRPRAPLLGARTVGARTEIQ